MYDVIVVGGGSAGAAVAARLSEDPATKVLLLEAGGKDRSLNIKIPAAFPKQFHDKKLDWDFETEPEPAVDGRRLDVLEGRSGELLAIGARRRDRIGVLARLRGVRQADDRALVG